MLELTETVDLEADSGDSKPIEDMQKQNFISIITQKIKRYVQPNKKKKFNCNNNRKQTWPENNEMKNEFEGGRNSKISERERGVQRWSKQGRVWEERKRNMVLLCYQLTYF